MLKASDSELTAMRDLFIEVYWVLIDEDGDTVDDEVEIEKGWTQPPSIPMAMASMTVRNTDRMMSL